MEFMGITSVATITVICYLLASGLKAAGIHKKWLPTLCGCLGGLLGLAAHWLMPGYPSGDLLTAIAVGIVSGLAATGGYEAVHQLKKEA